MTHLIAVALTLGYVFMSAFLETEGGSRVTPADLMLFGLMLLATMRVLHRGRLTVPAVHAAAVPMLVVFLVAAPLAFYADRAMFELIVILFSFFGSLAIVNLLLDMPEDWLLRFARGYVLVIGALAAVCIIDFLLLPGLVSSRATGGLQGPFRNTGQAGSFFGVHSTLVLALVVARVAPRKLFYVASVTCAILALAFTIKRASIMAMIIGLVALVFFLLLSPSARDKKIGTIFLLSGVVAAGLGFLLFQWALDAIPGLRWRIEYKFSGAAIENFSEGFLQENIRSMFAALEDSPLIGVGLDNVREIYQKLEIHSTYLGILAYGGLLGAAAYLFFMGTLLSALWRESRHKLHNVWAAFLYLLLPLLIGQMVGWGYTYHIRKREFWVLVIFVAIAVKLSRRARQQPSDGDAALNAAHAPLRTGAPT